MLHLPLLAPRAALSESGRRPLRRIMRPAGRLFEISQANVGLIRRDLLDAAAMRASIAANPEPRA